MLSKLGKTGYPASQDQAPLRPFSCGNRKLGVVNLRLVAARLGFVHSVAANPNDGLTASLWAAAIAGCTVGFNTRKAL
jgi:hypothetical protein